MAPFEHMQRHDFWIMFYVRLEASSRIRRINWKWRVITGKKKKYQFTVYEPRRCVGILRPSLLEILYIKCGRAVRLIFCENNNNHRKSWRIRNSALLPPKPIDRKILGIFIFQSPIYCQTTVGASQRSWRSCCVCSIAFPWKIFFSLTYSFYSINPNGLFVSLETMNGFLASVFHFVVWFEFICCRQCQPFVNAGNRHKRR